VDFLIAPSISNSVSITYDASVNFGFKPSILLVSIPSYAYTGYETSLNKITGVTTVNSVIRNIDGISKTIYMLGSSATTPRIQVNVTNVTENGFNISAARAGTQTSGCYLYLVGPFTYYAIGVGEEDTTLRDSLASILQEEGVNVTEEDDMASLITKVDEEFDNKNNEIINMKQDLANVLIEKNMDVSINNTYTELLDALKKYNVTPPIIDLIKEGDPCTTITGGWSRTNAFSEYEAEPSFYNNFMEMTISSSMITTPKRNTIATVKKINVTEYKELVLGVQVNDGGYMDTNTWFYVGLISNRDDDVETKAATYLTRSPNFVGAHQTTNGIYSLDVSSITGEYYIAFQLRAADEYLKVQVRNLYLKP
jgi:hypothetical protein